jgi:hypothetical protein
MAQGCRFCSSECLSVLTCVQDTQVQRAPDTLRSMGEMKMKQLLFNITFGVSVGLLLFFCFNDVAAQTPQKEGCFDGNNRLINCGESFTTTYRGLVYDCRCNCSGQDVCTPRSQSGSSGAGLQGERQGDYVIQQREEDNAAKEAEKERQAQEQEAFTSNHENLMIGLKGGTAKGTPALKTSTTALPLKNSSNFQAIGLKTYDVKEKTIKAIKELNCSAYWGLQSARALQGKDEVTKNLEDKYTLARRYGEYSALAKDGQSLSGCPEVKIISIPDASPPVEENPQVQVYHSIIQKIEILVPKIIETQKEIEKTKQSLEDHKKASNENRKETEQLVSKMITTKDEMEKEKMIAKYEENNKEYDELKRAAEELEKEADQLNTEASKQGETVADAQKIYDDVQANPERAKELTGKVR